MKESIRRAAESAKGRATDNPPSKMTPNTASKMSVGFYNVADYNPEYRKTLEKQS